MPASTSGSASSESPFARPIEVALTSSSARGRPLRRDHAELVGQRARPLGRAVPDGDLRARLAQRPDRRPRRAARPEHERARRTLARRARRSGRRRPCCRPSMRPPSSKVERVDGADRRGRLGQLVRELVRGELVRDRHVGARGSPTPAAPARSPRTARAAPAGGGSANRARARRTPRSSSRASGCARRGSRGRPRACSTVRRRLAAALVARGVVLVDVALELGVRLGELVAAVAADRRDVEEVVRARRVGRGADRRQAGVADRARAAGPCGRACCRGSGWRARTA